MIKKQYLQFSPKSYVKHWWYKAEYAHESCPWGTPSYTPATHIILQNQMQDIIAAQKGRDQLMTPLKSSLV